MVPAPPVCPPPPSPGELARGCRRCRGALPRPRPAGSLPCRLPAASPSASQSAGQKAVAKSQLRPGGSGRSCKGAGRGRCPQGWVRAAGTAAPAMPPAAGSRWGWTRPSQPPAVLACGRGCPPRLHGAPPACHPFPGLWALPGRLWLCACEHGGLVLGAWTLLLGLPASGPHPTRSSEDRSQVRPDLPWASLFSITFCALSSVSYFN